MVVGNKKNVAHPTWLSPRREREKVHDAIAYAPYNLRVINQTYAAYELRVTSYQSDICGLRVTIYDLSIRHMRLTSLGWNRIGIF